jgi:molybdenum cofactor cytidylyltransferase
VKFGPVPVAEAKGAIAAHSVRLAGGIIRKGGIVTAADISAMAAEGIAEIVVAQLEPGDLDENTAASRLALRLAGTGLQAEAAHTGRVNLHATTAGVLVLDEAAIRRFNTVDEAITLASLPAFRSVTAGELVATVKIIPYGVSTASLEAVLGQMPDGPTLRIAPFRPKRVGVISTVLPGLKTAVVDKTLDVLAARLQPAKARVVEERRVAHQPAALADAIRQCAAGSAEIIVIFGASAITDRRDVIPAALEAAGGQVDHLGMPVDPGNLLMLGHVNGKPVIGAPGCARSPKENGFDWVLQRLLADLHVSRADVQSMGVGGLLMEIVSRPQPRSATMRVPASRSDTPPVAALVLAAGRSSRMGERNKLLEDVAGKPMVRHAVEAAIASMAGPVIVVTGHGAPDVCAALAGCDVVFVHNADFASGLSSSLKAGLAEVPDGSAAALVLLADMPNVTPAIIDRLVAVLAECPDAKAVVPTLLGQRGNPVLITRGLFGEIASLEGDEGARRLLVNMADGVLELQLDDPAIALDIDTPEALATLRGKLPDPQD